MPDAGRLSVAQCFLMWTISRYQVVSRFTPSMCRFSPTCSEYTRIAVQRHGAVRGICMGLRRISRCHPFHAGGHDPVP
jgi:putative membrane protein insertion efficiency factor